MHPLLPLGVGVGVGPGVADGSGVAVGAELVLVGWGFGEETEEVDGLGLGDGPREALGRGLGWLVGLPLCPLVCVPLALGTGSPVEGSRPPRVPECGPLTSGPCACTTPNPDGDSPAA